MTNEGTKSYTTDQVKLHDTPDDLWMVIYNKVYDVTEFAKDHPGGVEVLYDCGGVDATEAFDDVAHSDDAVSMLAPYLVGKIIDHQQIIHKNPRQIHQSIIKRKKHSKKKTLTKNYNLEILIYLILIILASCAIGVYITIQKVKWSG